MALPLREVAGRAFGFAFLANVAATLLVFAHEPGAARSGPLAGAARLAADAYARVGGGDPSLGMLAVAFALWLPWFLLRRVSRAPEGPPQPPSVSTP